MTSSDNRTDYFFLPLPVRSNKYQFLGFGLSWENVDLSDNRIDGDNLFKVKKHS